MKEVDEKTATKLLKRRYKRAKRIIKDPNKTNKFLIRIEKKIRKVPKIGDKLSKIVVMVSMIRDYIKKDYTNVPIGTILSAVAALTYFLTPIDFIPDTIPGFGYVDDAAVIAVCWSLCESDIDEYSEWRKQKLESLSVI